MNIVDNVPYVRGVKITRGYFFLSGTAPRAVLSCTCKGQCRQTGRARACLTRV